MTEIRPATRADAAALGRLGAMLVRVHHDFDPLRFLAPRSGMEQGYGGFLASQLDEQDAILLVAETGGQVIGYVWGHVEGVDYMSLRGPAGVLEDILVDPAHRGQGIGRLLLEAMIKALGERGSPQVVLSTADRNEPAQRMFARAGFRRTMVEMTKEITPR